MVLAVSVVGLLAMLVMFGRYNELGMGGDWRTLVTPEGKQALQELSERFTREQRAVNQALGNPSG